MTASTSGAGIDGSLEPIGAGVSAMCAATSCCAVVRPANGCAPVSSSYAITPHAYRSARGSTADPTACSGAM